MTAGETALFPVPVVHCFACPYTVRSVDPVEAHDRMEDHYARRHAALITRLGYPSPARP